MNGVVITGVGAVTPIGHGSLESWKAVLGGRHGLAPISRFDAAAFSTDLVGEVRGLDDEAAAGARLVPQTDRSTRLSFVAAQESFQDARVDPGALDSLTAGVSTANFAGGFEFGQKELQLLWSQGSAYVSAYQSFAWFYAVNSGQLSIRHGLRGPSGVVVSDECGGIESLALARRAIRAGSTVQLCGAVDATLCSWGLASLQASGRLTSGADPASAYLPFDPRASGMVPGEGGGLLVLEEAGHAADRGADPYAVLAGHAASFDPDPGSPCGVVRCLRTALADADLSPEDIDVVFADGAGNTVDDGVEAAAIAEVFGIRSVPVTVPKTATGRLLSGGSSLDTVWAAMALRYGVVPPTLHSRPDDDLPLDLVVGEPRDCNPQGALILARGVGGHVSALVITKP